MPKNGATGRKLRRGFPHVRAKKIQHLFASNSGVQLTGENRELPGELPHTARFLYTHSLSIVKFSE
ncbi:MAG TPA: hypothetical protein VK699_05675 [Terriglobales bacterium]|jgi:hypothetical protein|nr:hypothetical protein [Terriglobales bacterium]